MLVKWLTTKPEEGAPNGQPNSANSSGVVQVNDSAPQSNPQTLPPKPIPVPPPPPASSNPAPLGVNQNNPVPPSDSTSTQPSSTPPEQTQDNNPTPADSNSVNLEFGIKDELIVSPEQIPSSNPTPPDGEPKSDEVIEAIKPGARLVVSGPVDLITKDPEPEDNENEVKVSKDQATPQPKDQTDQASISKPQAEFPPKASDPATEQGEESEQTKANPENNANPASDPQTQSEFDHFLSSDPPKVDTPSSDSSEPDLQPVNMESAVLPDIAADVRQLMEQRWINLANSKLTTLHNRKTEIAEKLGGLKAKQEALTREQEELEQEAREVEATISGWNSKKDQAEDTLNKVVTDLSQV